MSRAKNPPTAVLPDGAAKSAAVSLPKSGAAKQSPQKSEAAKPAAPATRKTRAAKPTASLARTPSPTKPAAPRPRKTHAKPPHPKNVHPTTQYALDVVHGKHGDMCGELEKLACERHLRDLERQDTDKFPYVFDESRANRIIDWYQKICRHVRGPYAGQLITLEPWQIFDKGCLYGWVRRDTGARRFSVQFQLRARGNVKSTENSADCCYSMCADAIYPPGHPEAARFETSPEVSCAAVDRLQAKRVWSDARDMALASPDIMRRLNVSKHLITHKTRGGFLLPLSKDTKNKDSGAQTYISIDEYHAWVSSEIKDTLQSGFGKRYQPLMSIISTAGLNAENNPCRKEQRTCEKILRGEIVSESTFVMIRTMDEGDDPHDPKNWLKPNPILRTDSEYSRTLRHEIEDEHNIAFGSGDYGKMREWLTKRANLWQETAENKYLKNCMEQLRAAGVSRKEFAALTEGHEVYTGCDLSKKFDLTADGYVIPLEDGRFAVSAHGYLPAEAVARHEQTDRVPYRMWINDCWCTETPGAVTDFSFINARMRELEASCGWKVREICYDPYQATHYAQQQEADGYTCVEIRQGFATLSEPTKLFREYIMQGKIVHDGSPLMLWCFGNAVEDTDSNGNIKLSKKSKDDSQRIDLAAAIINAFVRAVSHDFGGGGLFYAPEL